MGWACKGGGVSRTPSARHSQSPELSGRAPYAKALHPPDPHAFSVTTLFPASGPTRGLSSSQSKVIGSA